MPPDTRAAVLAPVPPPQLGLLTVNVGSSTLKYAFYPLGPEGVDSASLVGTIEGLQEGERAFENALQVLLQQLGRLHALEQVQAVVHRVVHGGSRTQEAAQVDSALLQELERLAPLAPLHQPHNLAGVRCFQAALPTIPQVVCFDTAFHAQQPLLQSQYGLPDELTALGIRSYGFHGLSYRHVVDSLSEVSRAARGRLLMAHLGNGASLCAARNGIGWATTMGFTALDGLMMGTRCGALDPGVVLYLLEQGWEHSRIQDLLYRRSGLLGVSGISSDLRALRHSQAPAAAFAIELFCARVVRAAGAMIAVLEGLDALAFTGGIGEHDAQLRAAVVSSLGWLGLVLDPAANRAACGNVRVPIHGAGSSAEIWVVPADEGRAAARAAWRLLRSPLSNDEAASRPFKPVPSGDGCVLP